MQLLNYEFSWMLQSQHFSLSVFTASMVEQLMRVPHVREIESSFPKDGQILQCCKRFATASTFTQLAVLL